MALDSNRSEYQGRSLKVKGGRNVELTLPPSFADFLEVLEVSTSLIP